MFLKYLRVFLGILMLTLFIAGCASRGRPSGGEKDILPPEIEKESPKNFKTNFKADEIRIYFNEYVKIKDLQKQLIISPPMNTQPVITPQGSASKYITIKIKDTLKENTTYAFNFGNSIVDNNEENPFQYYRYVFSTGATIDSLNIKGAVFDAEARNAESFVSVMLYEVDSSYTDSIVYKEKPKFITNTLDSLTTFSIDNIKAGKYKIVALKEETPNFTYEPKTDKIGFYEREITVPTDENFNITLFKEATQFKVIKPQQIAEQRIVFPFEGELEDVKINIESDSIKVLEHRITRDRETDSLYYWYKSKVEVDSVSFLVKSKSFTETFKYKFRKGDKDSLVISSKPSGTLSFNDTITLEATTPFAKIDTTKIKLIDKDSVRVAYNVEFDSLYNRYKFNIEKKESQKYQLELLPNAITDFYGAVNDTLNYRFNTKQKSDYGNIRVKLINAKLPLIVQLVNDKNEVLYEQYADKYPVIDFRNIELKQYQLRAVFDVNKNRKFDTGDYLTKRQPERISYSKPIDPVRANFDYEIEFTLKD